MTVRPAPALPFFLPVGPRRIFCLHHAPPGAVRGAIVYLPPFAEEMNKSRRMASLQSCRLAAAGWHVLQVDPCGTGDSDGDFADASWAAWLDDADAARRWLAARCGVEPWLWGLRLGCLLAACSLARRPAPGGGLLWWQPVLSGRQHLQQFLRLQAGAEWLATDRPASGAERPLDALVAGRVVEVAGYALAPALALPMAEASFSVERSLRRIACFEVSPRDGATLSPASQAALNAATAAGCAVTSAVVLGASFWQTQEIETVPALLRATAEAFAT